MLTIDGLDIPDGAHLKNYLIERTVPGQTVVLKVLRGDQELQLSIVLGGA